MEGEGGDGEGVVEDVPGDEGGEAEEGHELPALAGERCIDGGPAGEALLRPPLHCLLHQVPAPCQLPHS